MNKEKIEMEEPLPKTVKNQTELRDGSERRGSPLQNPPGRRIMMRIGKRRFFSRTIFRNQYDQNGFCVFISTTEYHWFNLDRAKVQKVSLSKGENIFYKVFLDTCSYQESLKFAKDEGVIAFKWTALTMRRYKISAIGAILTSHSAGISLPCGNRKCVSRCAGMGCLCIAGECV